MSTSTAERSGALQQGAHELLQPTGKDVVNEGKRGSALIKYDQCRLYDKYRRSVGMKGAVQFLRRAADRLHLPMREIEMSALCCGTGQNEAEMLRILDSEGEHIKSINCIDGSDGMLSWTREKLGERKEQVNVQQADVLRDELPFERQHFVSCIQAVQHFEDSRLCRHFTTLGTFYRRVRQKLVRRGEFFQIISLPDQVMHSYWFYNLISGCPGVNADIDPAHHFANEHPPLERVFANLETSGFKVRSWKLIRKPHFCIKSYYGNTDIVFDEEFRHCSSLFWIMKQRELQERYDEVARKRVSDGTASAHRDRVEVIRKQIGISIAISAEAV